MESGFALAKKVKILYPVARSRILTSQQLFPRAAVISWLRHRSGRERAKALVSPFRSLKRFRVGLLKRGTTQCDFLLDGRRFLGIYLGYEPGS